MKLTIPNSRVMGIDAGNIIFIAPRQMTFTSGDKCTMYFARHRNDDLDNLYEIRYSKQQIIFSCGYAKLLGEYYKDADARYTEIKSRFINTHGEQCPDIETFYGSRTRNFVDGLAKVCALHEERYFFINTDFRNAFRNKNTGDDVYFDECESFSWRGKSGQSQPIQTSPNQKKYAEVEFDGKILYMDKDGTLYSSLDGEVKYEDQFIERK